MHYYQFNIGDYASHTRHLDLLEDLAYRRILDLYYLHERPLSGDASLVAKQIGMRDDAATVRDVLNEFFEHTPEGFVNPRADKEIAHYHSKIEQASRAGKASAERRSNNRSTGVPTDVQPNNKQEPLNNKQEPYLEAKASLSKTSFPTCPHQEILNLYAKHLPHLSQPRVWEGNRQEALRARWRQAAKPSDYSPEGYKDVAGGLRWWDSFFGYIANDTKLAAGFETQGRTWRPDLEWIVTAGNFAKIIDGKYNK
jgi:uncharacterized protein YdaU (DUF1376 family)